MDFISAIFNGSLHSPRRVEPHQKRLIFSDLIGVSHVPKRKQANLEKRCWCLIRNGEVNRALRISSRIKNDLSRSQMQAAMSRVMGEKGDLNQEFFLAKQIPEMKCRGNALREAFFHAVEKKNWELTEKIARLLPARMDKIEAYSLLTKVYVYKKEIEKVRLATEYTFHHLKSPATIWEIKRYFLDRNELEEAFLFIKALPNECPTTLMLINLMNTCSEMGKDSALVNLL